jgi:hypothetical protein
MTTGQAPNLSTTSNTLRITGTMQGSTITLSFDDGPDAFGTLSGGSFTLNFPQPDGTLSPITFNSASASQYNSVLTNLKQRIAQANQTAANAQALQQEEQKIDSDASAVNADLNLDTSDLTNAVQSVQGTLQQEAKDLAATQAEEQKVVAEAPSGDQSQTCYDASSGVEYDASSGVEYDASSGVEYDASSGVERQATLLRSYVQSLQADFAQFQSDESNLPGYSPPNSPTQSQVNQTVRVTNAAISSAISTTNGYIDQANAEVTTAYQYVAQAYQAGNCGATPSAPAAQQRIS